MTFQVGMAMVAGRYVRTAIPTGGPPVKLRKTALVFAVDLFDGIPQPFTRLGYVSKPLRDERSRLAFIPLGADITGGSGKHFPPRSFLVAVNQVDLIAVRVSHLKKDMSAYEHGIKILKGLKPHLRGLADRIVPFDLDTFESTRGLTFDLAAPIDSAQLGLDLAPPPRPPVPAPAPIGEAQPFGLAAGLTDQNALFASVVGFSAMTERFARTLEDARGILSEMQQALTEDQRKRLPDSVQQILKAA